MKVIQKELNANETGETGSHQSGILISKDPDVLSFFPVLDGSLHNPRVNLDFLDENGSSWPWTFIYYNGGTRDEYRLTGMTGYFNEYDLETGSLLTFIRDDCGNYHVTSSPPSAQQPRGSWSLRSNEASDEVPVDVEVDLRATSDAFAEALQDSGISYGKSHHKVTAAFLASLATKRFVILTGLSGSGKTQIALKFGEWIGRSRSCVVPVRPDWTGAEVLFGYEDALAPVAADGRRGWAVPRPLEFMLAAAADRLNPYLLVLDEMNLAHVERYFADALSGMESGERVIPNLQRDDDGFWRLRPDRPRYLPLPDNLFVVGTVNIDETTYMFSPKVLDRANTLEFRVRTQDLGSDYSKPKSCEPGPRPLISGFLEVSRDPDWHRENSAPSQDEVLARLRELHGLLAESGFEFGHRTLFEALRFSALVAASGEEDPLVALDLQVMQKLLPRLHGSRRRLELTLCAIGRYAFDLTFQSGSVSDGAAKSFDPLASSALDAKLPVSFEKVQRMTRNLRANQFTSFTE